MLFRSASHLEKVASASGVKAEREALNLIARAAEGGMRDALSILDMCIGAGDTVTEENVRAALGTADRAFLFSFGDALARHDGGASLRLIGELMQGGRDVQVFLKDLSAHLRLLMASKLCGPGESLPGSSAENTKRYAEQAAAFSQERLLRIIDLSMRAEADTRWAASARSVLEVFALRACDQPEEMQFESLMERISELEMRLSELEKNGVKAPARAEKSAPAALANDASPLPPSQAAEESPRQTEDKPPKDIWNDALKLLKRSEPAIFGPLSQGKYGGCVNGVYRALFAKEVSFMMTMLSAPERRSKIAHALNQCGAQDAQFEALPLEAPVDPEQEKRQEKNLSGLVDMFGRDKVQIDE